MSELKGYGITDISGWKTVGYTTLTNEFKKVIEKYGFRFFADLFQMVLYFH
jgi:hypothetical protein